MSLPFTENFTDADFTLLHTHNAGWILATAGSDIVDIYLDGARNSAVNSDTTGAYWTGDTFGNDQSAQCVVKNSNCGPMVRASGVDGTFKAYGAMAVLGATLLQVIRFTSLTSSSYLDTNAGSVSPGDTIKITAIGTTIRVYRNGTEIANSPYTDSNISGASSSAGFFLSDYTAPCVDDFVGDTIGGGGGGGALFLTNRGMANGMNTGSGGMRG